MYQLHHLNDLIGTPIPSSESNDDDDDENEPERSEDKDEEGEVQSKQISNPSLNQTTPAPPPRTGGFYMPPAKLRLLTSKTVSHYSIRSIDFL